MKQKGLISIILYVLAGTFIFIGSLLKITHKGGDFFLSAGISLNLLFILGVIFFAIAFINRKTVPKEK